jgi:hypothetical protein
MNKKIYDKLIRKIIKIVDGIPSDKITDSDIATFMFIRPAIEKELELMAHRQYYESTSGEFPSSFSYRDEFNPKNTLLMASKIKEFIDIQSELFSILSLNAEQISENVLCRSIVRAIILNEKYDKLMLSILHSSSAPESRAEFYEELYKKCTSTARNALSALSAKIKSGYDYTSPIISLK